MKYVIIILLCIFSLNIFSNNIEITVNTPGALSQILGDDEDYLISISGLKIKGTINDDDFKIIRLLSQNNYILYKVSSLDLSECNIVGDTLKYKHLNTGSQSKIAYLNLPKTLKVIENDVFSINDKLRTIIIHEGLEYIGASAFAWANLSEITLPSTLKVFGSRSFSNCTIEKINCYSINPPETFKRIENGYEIGAWGRGWPLSICQLHVPIGSKSKYRASELFGHFSYIIQDLQITTYNENINETINSWKIIDNEIVSNNLDILVYNINGIKIDWKYKKLKGLYIIKDKNNIKKVLIWL